MKKGFALPLILGLIVALSVLGLVIWKYKQPLKTITRDIPEKIKKNGQEDSGNRVPFLTMKPLDTPSYLLYFKQTEYRKSGENSTYQNKIYIVNEDGSNKREIPNINQKPTIFGAENFVIEKNSKKIYFNSKGEEDKSMGTFIKRYNELLQVENPPTPIWAKGMRYGWGSYAFSPMSDLFAYARIGDTNEDVEIVVVNIQTNQEKIFNVKNLNVELGFTFHFSPDSKKLFACIDEGFYFDGPVQGLWEIDIENTKASQLKKIQNLNMKKCDFRYNPNTLYGSHFEKYGVTAQYEGQPVNRSNILYKINLDTKKIETINLQHVFHYLDISKTGSFAISTYQNNEDLGNYSENNYILNLNTDNEYQADEYFKNSDKKAWSDNDKLAIRTYDLTKTEIYIFDPATKMKTLVDTQERGTNNTSKTVELVGWIH